MNRIIIEISVPKNKPASVDTRIESVGKTNYIENDLTQIFVGGLKDLFKNVADLARANGVKVSNEKDD